MRKRVWQKNLTKAELEHLRETGGDTVRGFRENHEQHEKWRAEGREPCMECKIIARKLGLT